eukprot:TRINITY_DN5318_c0_g1_i2.p1 TRINITY_DN5318_c0_g1~~TRINITY_DN5318_c0_g1_i2.p1  ORF type:complete len:955 (-),score=273.67 TRINITY_DN5318_c0_g1_i2:490-3312(-)
MSRATGQTFQMVRIFMEDEFKKNTAATEGSIMRGNTIASRMTKEITNKIGRKYLQDTVGPFVHRIVLTEHKVSLEIDPSKCETPDEITTNKARLLEKTKNLIDTITSQQNIDRMPYEMRIIASFFAEYARVYTSKEIWPIVGGFLLLRYINPALMTPEAYGLLPEGKIPANIPRRNLILVSKILQNLSNGVEFGKKEQFMMSVNDFIKENKSKMEKYFENTINFSSKINAVPDLTPIDVEDLHLLHRVVTQNQDRIVGMFKSKDEAQKFSKLLDSLGSYQSKISFAFLPVNDRKTVMSYLEQRREEASFIGVVDKTKYGKFQKRTLMIGHNRIISFKPGGKIAREGHLLDLIEIKSPNPNELHLIFQTFAIVCVTDETLNIISCVLRSYYANFSGMPKLLQPKLTLDTPSRINVESEVPLGPCGGFVGTYRSLCDFYSVIPNFDVCWHFSNLPSRIKTFDLKRFAKSYLEESLTSADLGPLFWALRFNTYFDTLIIKNFKLDKESFLDMVESVKFNRTVTTLILSNISSSKESFQALFDALIANKACAITSLDISNNPIEDKGIAALGSFISVTSNPVSSINVSNTNMGKEGLATLCGALKDRMKVKGLSSIAHLSISDNKLQKASEALFQMVTSVGTTLKSLSLANTGCNLQMVLEGLKKGSPAIQHLDISKNKMKPADGPALVAFLETATSLTELNMASNKCPIESLRDILTSVSKDTYLKIDLSDNGLNMQAAEIISSMSLKISNIHTLNISDNEFGEEGISAIAEGLCSNTTLKNLVLDRNFSKSGKPRKEAIENLIKLLESTRTLEGLSLVGGGSKSDRLKQDIVPFLCALGRNKSITSLDIRSHHMGNKGAVALSKGLRQNDTLVEVHWDDNMTGLLGFINVKNALKVNQTLRDMPLPIADVGHVLKNESAQAKEIHHALNKIEQRILRNQQVQ